MALDNIYTTKRETRVSDLACMRRGCCAVGEWRWRRMPLPLDTKAISPPTKQKVDVRMDKQTTASLQRAAMGSHERSGRDIGIRDEKLHLAQS